MPWYRSCFSWLRSSRRRQSLPRRGDTQPPLQESKTKNTPTQEPASQKIHLPTTNTAVDVEQQPNALPPPKQQSQKQSGSQSVQRAFPFEDSYLDIWEAKKYLDVVLGEGCYQIMQESDRWILFADRDLKENEITELGKKSGRGESDDEST